MKIVSFTLIGIILLWMGRAYGEACEIVYTRTACPGKEAISFHKCKGRSSCARFRAAKSLEECQEMALQACANQRLTITQSKVIRAKFDGQAIKTQQGKDDFCLDYALRAEEYFQCE